MSRIPQMLMKYQKDYETKVKKIKYAINRVQKKIIQRISKSERVSIEDLSRTYSADDVRQLCLRTKVRVDMTRFNCLWEAKKRFEKEDRFKNRSEDFINKMYIKAVEKGIVVPYKPEEIEIAVHIERCKLKKVNNQRLDKWRRLTSQASSTLLPHNPNGSKVKSDTLIISDDSEEDRQAAALEIPNSTMCLDSEMEMHLELSDEDYATFKANVRSTSTPIDEDLKL